jgi:hypothetical protein
MTFTVMRTLEERFREKFVIDASSGCWLWTGATDRGGYGQFAVFAGNASIAHRVSYRIYRGEIPEGLQLDHLCRVRHCVNPDHLEPVTHRENMRRGVHACSLKTHCPRGHAYDEENTYWIQGRRRQCRACGRIARAAHNARKGGVA